MVCPMKMVGKSTAEILKEREYAEESAMQCEEKQCAWWIEDSNSQYRFPLLYPSGCAIGVLAYEVRRQSIQRVQVG